MVFQMGLYFILRSVQEHWHLRYHCSQVTLFEPPGKHAYSIWSLKRMYQRQTKGVLNTWRKYIPKEVVHYSNQRDPLKCFVCLYSTFFIVHQTCQVKLFTWLPKGEIWLSRILLDHNKLQKTISNWWMLLGMMANTLIILFMFWRELGKGRITE